MTHILGYEEFCEEYNLAPESEEALEHYFGYLDAKEYDDFAA